MTSYLHELKNRHQGNTGKNDTDITNLFYQAARTLERLGALTDKNMTYLEVFIDKVDIINRALMHLEKMMMDSQGALRREDVRHIIKHYCLRGHIAGKCSAFLQDSVEPDPYLAIKQINRALARLARLTHLSNEDYIGLFQYPRFAPHYAEMIVILRHHPDMPVKLLNQNKII